MVVWILQKISESQCGLMSHDWKLRMLNSGGGSMVADILTTSYLCIYVNSNFCCIDPACAFSEREQDSCS